MWLQLWVIDFINTLTSMSSPSLDDVDSVFFFPNSFLQRQSGQSCLSCLQVERLVKHLSLYDFFFLFITRSISLCLSVSSVKHTEETAECWTHLNRWSHAVYRLPAALWLVTQNVVCVHFMKTDLWRCILKLDDTWCLPFPWITVKPIAFQFSTVTGGNGAKEHLWPLDLVQSCLDFHSVYMGFSFCLVKDVCSCLINTRSSFQKHTSIFCAVYTV